MSWTVACFCGNVYTAPPARCDVCDRTLSSAVTDRPAAIVRAPESATPTTLRRWCEDVLGPAIES
jgi:hypothetical protein